MRGFAHSERGLTLVELIIVLAIISIITAVAIPGLMRFGAFSDDSMQRTSREVFELLSAARIYATTYNVRTAVVYSLDHNEDPVQNPLNAPVAGGAAGLTHDSLTGSAVRYLTAATMMYALPGSAELFNTAITQGLGMESQDGFVPMSGNEGQWKQFPDNVALMLADPARIDADSYNSVYYSETPRFNIADDVPVRGVSSLGLFRGLPVILDFDTLAGLAAHDAPVDQQVLNLGRYVAHVFTPDGRLETPTSEKERYTFYMGYRPDEPLDRRLTDPTLTKFVLNETDSTGKFKVNLRVIPIEIYRSTGRVKIAS